MAAPIARRMWQHPVAWAAVGYGLFVYLSLPAGVVALNDDFGYLRSVIETVRRGRPWTDDWLEPWGASLSIASALVYALTGSFLLAVKGVQAICGATAFLGAYAAFRQRGLGLRTSIITGLVLVTVPTLFWKSVEFTGVAFYLPCLLWAVWAAGARRWGVFFVVWALAFANRQSAVAWLVVPAFAIVANWRADSRWSNRIAMPVFLLAAAGGFVALLSLGMNKTHAQAMITDQLWEHTDWRRSATFFAIGVWVMVISLGLGAWAWRPGGTAQRAMAFSPARLFIVLVGLAIGLTFFQAMPALFFEHSSFENVPGHLYLILAAVIAAGGWIAAGFVVRRDFLVAAISSVLITSLRPAVWDYYLMDAAVFSFFSAVGLAQVRLSSVDMRWPRWTVVALLGAATCFHLYFVWQIKCRVDRDYATVVLAEKALRADRLSVTDLSFAPYGFVGWQLHPYYVANDGKSHKDTGGFMRYLSVPSKIEVRFSPRRFWRDSRSLRPIEGEEATRVIGSEIFRIGVLWSQRVSLLDARSAAQAASPLISSGRISRRTFPLNDVEWQREIDSTDSR